VVAAVVTQDLELSILMPCLNEALTLEACIGKAKAYLASSGVAGEVVVADNGSTDGSIELAERLGARVIRVPERGYGAALYHGTMGARGRYVIMGDSDDSYDFSSLAPFLVALRAGAELVMGNRFAGGIRPGAMPWKNRYIGNPVLSTIGRVLFKTPVRDFHCGLRGVSRAAFERMELRTSGMEFASEMVIKATLLGMDIREVPTTLDKDGRDRPPHLRPWRDGWRHIRFMLIYSPRWLFLYPGLLMMLVGTIFGGLLLRGPVMLTATIGFDVHTLLYAAASVLLGYQGVAFYFFARIFALKEGLLPQDRVLDRLFGFFTLEVGLVVGVVLFLGGLGGSVATVLEWRSTHFGALSPQKVLRAAIPAMTALTLGGEVILTSFFLSLLGMPRRR